MLSKKSSHKIIFVITLLLFVFSTVNAQIKSENFKLGFTYGAGSQDKFPYDLDKYSHSVSFYKVQLNYVFKQKRKWSYEINIEPSLYFAEHQLLILESIKPEEHDNYEELRALFSQKRNITEYVLNLGIVLRYNIFNKLSLYAIGGVGPMISNKETERLAKGYAFSDVVGLGVTSYILKKVQLDFRYSLRHTSNLDFKQPNKGHNTTNAEVSVFFKL